jgi:hypothetical protein
MLISAGPLRSARVRMCLARSSWIQYFELDRENWYGPVSVGDAGALWQVDVIGPHELLPSEKEARMAIDKVTKAIRSVAGDGVLAARGP